MSDGAPKDPMDVVAVSLLRHQWEHLLRVIDRCEGFPSYNEQVSVQNARDMIAGYLRTPTEPE